MLPTSRRALIWSLVATTRRGIDEKGSVIVLSLEVASALPNRPEPDWVPCSAPGRSNPPLSQAWQVLQIESGQDLADDFLRLQVRGDHDRPLVWGRLFERLELALQQT